MSEVLDNLLLIVGTLGPAIAAVWYFITKRKNAQLQAQIEEQQKTLDANIAARHDEQEFTQEQQREQLKYQQLQASWQADASMELLRQTLDYIENDIVKRLEQIERQTRRLEQTHADSRGTLEILTRTIAQLVDSSEKFRRELIQVIRRKL